MDFFRVFITAPISLTVLFLLAKLMGNKQMSELNMFDYINGITIVQSPPNWRQANLPIFMTV